MMMMKKKKHKNKRKLIVYSTDTDDEIILKLEGIIKFFVDNHYRFEMPDLDKHQRKLIYTFAEENKI